MSILIEQILAFEAYEYKISYTMASRIQKLSSVTINENSVAKFMFKELTYIENTKITTSKSSINGLAYFSNECTILNSYINITTTGTSE